MQVLYGQSQMLEFECSGLSLPEDTVLQHLPQYLTLTIFLQYFLDHQGHYRDIPFVAKNSTEFLFPSL